MADLSQLPLPTTVPTFATDQRAQAGIHARVGTAALPKELTLSTQTPNSDETNPAWPDHSGTYSKALEQDSPGIVNAAAFSAFRTALGTADGKTIGSGNFSSVTLGGTTKLNGPQGAFARQPVGLDSQAFESPPAFTVDSLDYGVELIELYWASLLRDVAFTDYAGNEIAKQAAKELSTFNANYYGPKMGTSVTPDLLFRGGFTGEAVGPYLSQLCIQPTSLGAQAIDQTTQTFIPGRDFMTDLPEWFNVQKGLPPSASLTMDSARRYMHNGRCLAAYTHVDELYQAYFIAYLVLKSWGVSLNKGIPYAPAIPPALPAEVPFGTFGGPDIAATIAAVAKAAINAVWYQKWVVHLRHRPEAGGGLVHLKKISYSPAPKAKVHAKVLTSKALAASFDRCGSYLLSQAFPEGSPPHPAYPTGHGAVAGACITALKFFFNCKQNLEKFTQPVIPASDGLSLSAYTGADASAMTIAGELHKIAHNISFGHGIHAGIHWRSDTDQSILFGERVAVAFLKDQVWSYNESVNVPITGVDGTTTYTIANI
jgi:hypothetical protein